MHQRAEAGTRVDDDALIATIDACRRRLLWVAFVRIAPAAVALALAAASLTALASGFELRSWLLPAWAGGIALAALAVWLRAPSRGDCAAAIDHALALPDVVVAGMNLRDSRDPVGTLVVRDAAARLRGVSPAQVFPVRLDARSRAAAAVCVVGTLTIAVGFPPQAAGPDLRTSGSGAGIGAGPAEAVAAVGDAAPGGRTHPAESARDAAFAKAIAPLEQPTATEAASRTATSAAPAGDRGRSGRETRAGEGALNRVHTSATANAAPSADRPEPAAASGRKTDSPAGEATAARGAGGDDRGTRGGAGSQPPLAAAGGLTGGTRAAPASRGRVQRPDGRADAARYNAARDQAEAALRRDDVPPAYREYVRRYFEAIAPEQE